MSEEVMDDVVVDEQPAEVNDWETQEDTEVNEETSEEVEETQADTEPAEKTFTQSELDDIITKRLSRERGKFEQEQTTLKQQAKDEYIASQDYEWNGKKITTESEYKAAMQEKDMYEKLVNNEGFSEKQAQLLASERTERESIRKELESLKEEKQQTNAIVDVMNWHDEMVKAGVLTEAFDYSKIPDEVLNNKSTLKESYMNHVIKNMRVTTQQETLKNMDNKKDLSVGSTQDNTVAEEGQLSIEQIERMASGANGEKWVKDNYDKIVKAGYFK